MRLEAELRRRFPGGPEIQAAFQVPLGAPNLTVLFGPSGCGKTTVLRMLAGLERPDSGRIQLGGEPWFDSGRDFSMPTRHRRVGMVFQEAALFPHLDVRRNLGFGLGDLPRSERARRCGELAELAGITELLDRRPHELSGGQQQRVALARALAPHPRLLLLDEPFASLDRIAAIALRHRLRGILRQLGIPALLVTHDRSDALALGDDLILMEGGRIVRQAPPAELLSHHPPEAGAPETEGLVTILRARCLGRREGLLHLGAGGAELFAPDPGGEFQEVHACIRAEGISLERTPPGTITQRNRLSARVLALHPQGPLTRVELDCGFALEALITTWAAQDLGLKAGDRLHALIKATAVEVIPIEA